MVADLLGQHGIDWFTQHGFCHASNMKGPLRWSSHPDDDHLHSSSVGKASHIMECHAWPPLVTLHVSKG